MHHLFPIAILLFGGSMSLIGCTDANQQASQQEQAVADSVEVVVQTPEPGPNVLYIEANDLLRFIPDTLTASAGLPITLSLTHIGDLPVHSMGHNWVLLKPGTDVEAFAIKALDYREQDFIPTDLQDKIIAYTEMIGGGEHTSVTFEAPEPGVYDFICTFPNHYGFMKGHLRVQ